MNKILTILAALAELLGRYFRVKEQREHDDQQQKIKDNPAVWFDDHFNHSVNGVRHNEPMPDNANQAKQTSPTKHTKND